MTRIVLEIAQDKDLDLLLALLDRLNVTVVQQIAEKEQSTGATEDQDYILRGFPFGKVSTILFGISKKAVKTASYRAGKNKL
ncbi:MAG: hypothetical protein KF852_14010 [Saprospiraceae bacterium]|nr:hypothetical protein [Saprospiraceae bacterium]